MIEIPLTKGRVAIIDDEDAEVATHSWYAHGAPAKGTAYARRSFPRGDGTRGSVLLHRAIMNAAPGDVVDHIDGDGLNCRRSNLRFVTSSQNACNRAGARADNRFSKYLGVHYRASAQIYLAQITVAGKKRHLGCFKTAEEAHAARLAAERELWGVVPRRASLHR